MHQKEVHPWSAEYLQVIHTEKWLSKPAAICTSFLCHFCPPPKDGSTKNYACYLRTVLQTAPRRAPPTKTKKKENTIDFICLCVLRSKGKWAAHQRPEMLSTENLLTTVESHIQTWAAIKLNLRGVKTRRLEQRHRVTDKNKNNLFLKKSHRLISHTSEASIRPTFLRHVRRTLPGHRDLFGVFSVTLFS